MKMGRKRKENIKKERKQKKNEREKEWEWMKAVSGRKNGEKKWPLGFDFWNGWWRLKMKKNGQDQFSHMGIESWAQGWAKIKME